MCIAQKPSQQEILCNYWSYCCWTACILTLNTHAKKLLTNVNGKNPLWSHLGGPQRIDPVWLYSLSLEFLFLHVLYTACVWDWFATWLPQVVVNVQAVTSLSCCCCSSFCFCCCCCCCCYNNNNNNNLIISIAQKTCEMIYCALHQCLYTTNSQIS